MDKTKNYCRCRKLEPTECKKGTFVNKHPKGRSDVLLTMCKTEESGDKLVLQSISKKHKGKSCPVFKPMKTKKR